MCRDCNMNDILENHYERVVHFHSSYTGEGSFSMFAGCERTFTEIMQFVDERMNMGGTALNGSDLPARLTGGVRPYRWTVEVPTEALLAAFEKVMHTVKGEFSHQSEMAFNLVHRGKTLSMFHHFNEEAEYIGSREDNAGAVRTIVHLRPAMDNHSLRVIRQLVTDLAFPFVTPRNAATDDQHSDYFARGINHDVQTNSRRAVA